MAPPSQMNDLLREACEARADLERVFAVIAESFRQMAEVMAESSAALAAATAREQTATTQYIAALERIIALQNGGAELN